MTRLLLLLILTVFAVLPSAKIFGGGITAALITGMAPNLLYFNQAAGASQVALNNFVNADNISNPGNSEIISNSASLVGIPIGLNFRYLEQFYLIKLSMSYYFSMGGKNEIATNLLSQKRSIIEDIDLRMFEIPLSFAFNIRNDAYTRFYAGGGPTLFFGSAQITHDSGTLATENGVDVKLLPDYDVFSGWTLGAHLLVGAEVSLSESASLGIEVIFNFGRKAPVLDDNDSITTAEKSNIQQIETLAAPDTLGVYKAGNDSRLVTYDTQHPAALNFTGTSIMISVNFFLGAL